MNRFVFLAGLLATVLPMHAFDVFVAGTGSDNNPGTVSQPLATLTAARDHVRALRTSGSLPPGTVTVWLRGGYYDQPASVAFTSADSGSALSPVVYASYAGEEAHVTGAITLDPNWFTRVTSSSPVWGRLDSSAQGQIYQVDLKAHGITNWGTLQARGFGLRAPAPMELFVNGQAMTLARWPNVGDPLARTAGTSSSTQFTYTGTRPARWTHASDVWMQGFWSQDWADFHVPVGSINTGAQTITLASAPAQYGMGAQRPFYAYNLLEELDTPGEYYLDRSSGILYYWPTASLAGSVIQVSLLETPVAALSGTSYLTFRGIVFEAARGPLVTVTDGDHNQFDHCLLRNAGQYGAQITGTSNGLTSSQIAFCGEEGVRVSGGDRASLTAGNNYVTHSQIHATGRIGWTYKPGINLEGGCGNSATNNLIDDLPHTAILFTGNNHMIAYNEIWHVCQTTGDSGAIYCGRNWGYRGNTIEYNYLHDISSSLGSADVNGVYLDDCMSGVTVFSNIFYQISGTALFCGGGRDNLMTNNLIAYCGTAHYDDDRGISMIDNSSGDPWNLLQTLGADNVQYQQGNWASAYPACAAIPNSWTQIQKGLWRNPQNSVFSHNAGWGNSAWTFESDSSNTGVFSVYASMTDNNSQHSALFTPAAAEDRSARPATLAAALTSFTPVPFASIGPDLSAEPAATIAPATPLLTGQTDSAAQVDLQWTLLAGATKSPATSFSVQYLNGSTWSTFESLGGQVDFSTVSGLSAATAYTFRVVATNAAGSSTSNSVVLTTGPAPLQTGAVTRIEAESPLNVVKDVASNGTIGISDGTLDSGASVRMYDTGDAIRINFTTSNAGTYELGLRVRSGGSTGPTSFWPNGYSAQLDGSAVTLTGDSTTLSALDPTYGGCFWGTMVSAPLSLTAGSHSLIVSAQSNWAVVDCLDVTQMLASSAGQSASSPAGIGTGAVVASSGSTGSNNNNSGSNNSSGSNTSTGDANLPNSSDIGSVNSAGSTALANGVYTLTGSGADIWNSTVGFHYDYQTMTGDGTIVARVASLQKTDGWAKAGVMIRSTSDPLSPYAAVFVTAANGIAFQWGAGSGAPSASLSASGSAPALVRLTRSGNSFVAASSADGNTWTTIGAATIAMGASVNIGLAVTSHNAGVAATATFDSFSLTGTAANTVSGSSGSTATGTGTGSTTTTSTSSPGSTASPTAWTSADIGTVAIAGSAAASSAGVYTLKGAGADIWNSTVGFQYDYQMLSGDGVIVARVTGLQNTDNWAKAGVMIRDTTAAQAAYAAVFLAGSNGVAFQGGSGNGAASWSSSAAGSVPSWVRLTRSGNKFIAECSADGAKWTNIATTTVAMGANVCIGLAVTSHNSGQAATATFDSVSVTGTTTAASVPASAGTAGTAWTSQDVGSVAIAGTTAYGSGVYTLTGSGADIWNSTVGFQYTSQAWASDGTITAHIASLQNTNGWAKAGIMIRAGSDPAAPFVALFATPSNGLAFQWRTSDNSDCGSTSTSGNAPSWVRIVRSGSTFSAYTSSNGTAWNYLGKTTITINSPATVGLAVSSHNNGVAATAKFDSVTLN